MPAVNLPVCLLNKLLRFFKSTSRIGNNYMSGADPGILVRGGVDFFFKGIGFGGHLKAPSGGPGGEAPESS